MIRPSGTPTINLCTSSLLVFVDILIGGADLLRGLIKRAHVRMRSSRMPAISHMHIRLVLHFTGSG